MSIDPVTYTWGRPRSILVRSGQIFECRNWKTTCRGGSCESQEDRNRCIASAVWTDGRNSARKGGRPSYQGEFQQGGTNPGARSAGGHLLFRDHGYEQSSNGADYE